MHVETTKDRLFSGICFAVPLVAMIVVGFAWDLDGISQAKAAGPAATPEENAGTDVEPKNTYCGHQHTWGRSETTGVEKCGGEADFCSHIHKFKLEPTTRVAGNLIVLDWCDEPKSNVPKDIKQRHYHNIEGSKTSGPH